MRLFGLLAILACACGAPGNPLGLAGEYRGTLTEDATGTLTTFGTTTTTSDVTASFESTSSVSLEAAYGGANATLFNIGGCTVKLTADGEQLILEDKTECTATQSITSTAGATSTVTKKTSTTTVTTVTASKSGELGLKVDAEYDLNVVQEANGDKTSENGLSVQSAFDGDRVAAE